MIETQALAPLAMPSPPSAVPRRDLGGLLALVEGKERPLPLRSVRVRARIAGDCCHTVIEQRFANGYEQPLEAVHLFPLPPDGALLGMVLRAGDRELRAECRRRSEAEGYFDAARRDGRRAALLTAERADVHTLRVTNLPPGDEVTVRLELVERLEHADGRFLWRFPTVIAPRFLPGEPVGHAGPGILPDTDRVPDASRLQPPLSLAGGTPLDLEVRLDGPVASLASSLHAVAVDLRPEDGGGLRVVPAGSASLDRDFVLGFSLAAEAAPGSRAWTDGSFTLAIVEAPADGQAAPPRDAVFVLDRSGSMAGSKMAAARLALKAALHGLLPGDRFQLLAFDNVTEAFSEAPVPYTDEAMARAEAWLDGIEARGGTMLLPALRAALAGETAAGRLRTVLLITDGEAWDEAELVSTVAHRRGGALVFTMGIDTAVNAALLTRLARVGGGTCELLTPRDDIEAAVARLEARFGSPVAEELQVSGATPAREGPLALFAGRPLALLLEGAPERLVLRAQTPAGPLAFDLRPEPTSLPLGPLWARERVAALEDRLLLRPFEEDALLAEITRVALAQGIASRGTAFVAVDTAVTSTGERVEVVQPVALPLDWDPAFLEAPVAAAGMARLLAAPVEGRVSRMMAPFRARAKAPGEGRSAAPAGGGSGALPREDQAALDLGFEGLSGPVEAAPPPADPLAERVRAQRADGSWDEDVGATVAALLALLLGGHSRRAGTWRRAVSKAAAWLGGRQGDVRAAWALELLAAAEAGLAAETLRARAAAGPPPGPEGEGA